MAARRARRRVRLRRRTLATLVGLAVVVAAVAVGVKMSGLHLPHPQSCRATVAGHTASLSPTQAGYAALIAAGSLHRDLPPRAASIALAAALQESGLHNLDSGDRDSVGLFQQRPSQGWGSAAQIMDPYYATARFYAALARVPGYTVRSIADAAQAVQHSADGGAYARHEADARTLASALTGQAPAAFGCTLNAPATAWSPARLAAELHRAFGTPPLTTAAGTTLTVRTDADPTNRLGWAVAGWAVANADQAGVIQVTAAGRQWTRSARSATWRPANGSASGPPGPAGRVVIELGVPAGG